MLLVEKSDGSFKSRGYKDGQKQREKIIKEDSSSPTVELEIIMIMSAIEYHEECGLSTINISGAYLHTENVVYLIMLLRVRLE